MDFNKYFLLHSKTQTNYTTTKHTHGNQLSNVYHKIINFPTKTSNYAYNFFFYPNSSILLVHPFTTSSKWNHLCISSNIHQSEFQPQSHTTNFNASKFKYINAPQINQLFHQKHIYTTLKALTNVQFIQLQQNF